MTHDRQEMIVKMMLNTYFEDDGADDGDRDEMIDNDPDGI